MPASLAVAAVGAAVSSGVSSLLAPDAGGAYAGGLAGATQFQQEALQEQLKLGRESLALQEEMFETALGFGEPYRDAGQKALANYESMIYGIPIEQTASYGSAAAQRQQSVKDTKLPYESREEFEEAVRKVYEITKKRNQNIPLYYNEDTGRISSVSGTPLPINTQKSAGSPNEELFQADIDKAWGAIQPEPRRDIFEGEDVTQAYDWQTSPGYEFRREEGQKAIERSASARSGLTSGAQLKAIERYGQDTASLEFDKILGRLSGLTNTGANMAGSAANLAVGTGQQMAGTLGNMADMVGTTAGNLSSLSVQGGANKAGQAGPSAFGQLASSLGGIAQGYFGGGGGSQLGYGGTFAPATPGGPNYSDIVWN